MLRLAPSSVATLANSLAKAGLVVRSGGTEDRRTALRELTGAVDALADDVQRDARQIADEATD